MANELKITAGMSLEQPDADPVAVQVSDLDVDLTNRPFAYNRVLVGITESAVPMGGVTSPGWLFILNRDATGTVTVRRSTGVDPIATIPPGESFGPVKLGTSMQTPYLISDTANTDVEVLVTST